MIAVILFYIFMLISIVNLFHFAFYLIGADYYDIQQAKRANLKVKRPRKSPYVTVLISAFNEELAIARCLDTILKSAHRNIEIIVVDDGSKDNTAKIVRAYIKSHPKRLIKLYAKRKNVGKGNALNYALRKGVRGEFVMTLDADSVLHRKAISNAIRYFNDPKVVGVAANVRVLDNQTIIGLLQKFEYMVGYRSKKFYTATNCEFIVGGVASTYRYDKMKEVGFYDNYSQTEDIGLSMKVTSYGNKEYRLVYAADVVAMTEGVQTFTALLKQRYRWKMGSLQCLLTHRGMLGSLDPKYTRSLTFYRLPMAFLGELIVLLEPLVIGYVIYLSILALSSSAFIGAYATITAYLLWTIWPDEHMDLKGKFKMSFYAPVMYFLFYTMNVVQLVAIVRCLKNNKLVTRKIALKTSWVSPERSGQKQVTFS